MLKVANIRACTRAITHIVTAKHLTNAKSIMVLVSSLSNMVQLCCLEETRNSYGNVETCLNLVKKFPIANCQHSIQASFSPLIHRFSGSRNLVTGSEDGTVFIFNLDKKGEPWINQLMGHESPVVSTQWSGDGSILITADTMGSVVIWLRDCSSE